MKYDTLKKELESLLLITKWSPSESQLKLIADRISGLSGAPNKSDIGIIVSEVYGTYECIMLEGVDNSDLTTLLILATKVGSDND
jgi:hypothetical protein